MTRTAQVVAVAFLASLCVVSGNAAGSSEATEVGRTQLGVLGEPGRFAKLTGQRSAIQHSFIGWHQPNTLRKLLHRLKPLPMVAIKTGGVVTPLGIAQGRGDGFLVELNAALDGRRAIHSPERPTDAVWARRGRRGPAGETWFPPPLTPRGGP